MISYIFNLSFKDPKLSLSKNNLSYYISDLENNHFPNRGSTFSCE
jgi:hypothetical protein